MHDRRAVFHRAHNARGRCVCARRHRDLTARRPTMQTRRLFFAAVMATGLCAPALAQDKSIVVASTTSTQDSGLFGYLLPIFKQASGITVKVIAQGTGQALDTARRGDPDVAFLHARAAEEK